MSALISRRSALLLFNLVIVLLLAVLVRAYADAAAFFIKPYIRTFYQSEAVIIDNLRWWQWLLPIGEWGARWGTTGFLLVHWIEGLIGEPWAYYVLNVTMVAVGYLLSYLVFKSLLLSFLFGVALATTTFNYHVYAISGSEAQLATVTFLFIFAFCQLRYVVASGLAESRIWGMACIVSCIAFALSYEGWLDIVPLMLIVHGALAWMFAQDGNRDASNRCIHLIILAVAAAAIYVIVKAIWGLNGLHPKGGEGDLLFTYGRYVPLMIEDMISSFFTFFFTTISTYFPPQFFSYSMSSWLYGPEKLIALQEGYQPQAEHLTRYNHLFLWRYYAGFFLAVFLALYWKVIKRLLQERDIHHIILFILMTCTLIGSPTHMIIKWRPMHSAPFLGYQCYLSIAGYTLLLCYWVSWKCQQLNPRAGRALAASLVLIFGICAMGRPSLLGHMSQQSFLGPYPNPMAHLRSFLRSLGR